MDRTSPATTIPGSRPLLPRQALFGNPQHRALRLSPDGKWISLIAPHDGVPNIWLAPSGDIAAMRPLTRERGHGIQTCRWTADSARLVYVRDQDGDENHHLFALRLDTGEAIDLTPLDGIAVRIVAASRRHPTKLLIGLNDRDRRWHDIYLLDLGDGTRELVLRNDRFVTFCADRDLVLRLAVAPTADGGLDYMVPDGNDGWRHYLRVQEEDALSTGIAGFGPHGSNIAYLIDSRGRDRARAVTLDLATGATTELASHPNAEVVGLVIDPIDRGVQAVRMMHLRAEWLIMDKRIERDFARLSALDAGEFQILSRTADDRQWIVAHTGDQQPGVYHLYDRDSGQVRHLMDIRPELSAATFSPMQPLTIAARDGLDLPAYLTRPAAGNATEPTSMVLMVHGGPWSRDTWGFNPWHQWLADRGYAVLSVNYRGSTGFGKAFTNAGDREWGGRMQEDLLDAVDWAVRTGVADPARIAIMGASYGGYATLVALSTTPTVFTCGIDIFGPSDLEALIANIPPYWQPLIALWHRRVGDIATQEGRQFLRTRSPLHQADRICRPLLIAHGNNDARISVAASEAIVAACQRNNHPVMFLRYPDEGHSLIRHENRLSFHAVAEVFLALYLGGRCEPAGSDLQGSSMQVEAGADLLRSFMTVSPDAVP